MKLSKKSPHFDQLSERKSDHIELSSEARTGSSSLDRRFNYEPLFCRHPLQDEKWPSQFLGFSFDFPIWVSSMTGGAKHASIINQNLAKLCEEFHLGMGLGSCRSLLYSSEIQKKNLQDFQVKKWMPSAPLFSNIGIAQLENCCHQNKLDLIEEMVSRTEADGLIVHVNPLQEWFQPEGDRFSRSPWETFKQFFDQRKSSYPVIVKEVGQGMGPQSLKVLLEFPIAAIELAGFGGTNFSLLETLRGESHGHQADLIKVGHTCKEMIQILNALPLYDKEFIISGGITSMLDGFELKSLLKANSLIGMASAFLAPALESYESLKSFFIQQKEVLLVARSLLDLREK